MHEASVTEAIVKMATEEAVRQGAIKVNSISLVIGETTGYMKESLDFYFRNFSRGTILEGATLAITYVKPKIKCPKCGLLFERKLFTFDCPECGTPGEMTKTGNEFYIDTIDIEKESR